MILLFARAVRLQHKLSNTRSLVTFNKYQCTATKDATAVKKPSKSKRLDNTNGCQLAESIDGLLKPFKPNKEYFVEPKLDGVRLLTYLNADGTFEMFSRNGLKYQYFQLVCKDEISKLYESVQKLNAEEKEIVLDGEMMSSDQNFGSVVALGHSSNVTRDMPLHYYVFDVIFKSDFLDKGKKLTQAERKIVLEQVIPNTSTEIPGQKVIVARLPHTIQSFAKKMNVMELVNEYKAKGYEGLILKNPQGHHMRRRHAGIIKAKTSDTYDLQITGFKIEKGELKQLVLTSKNNKIVNVGNGMPDALKADVLDKRDKYLGRIVEVSALSISGNTLRFATFIKFRPDKSEPDAF